MNLFYKQITLNESLKIISSNNYCHLGLSLNNKPYVIPMNYNIINEHNKMFIELISLKNTKKINILNNNCFVNVCVEEVLDSSVISVICYGKAIKINSFDNDKVKIVIQIENITGRIICNNYN